MLVMEPSSRPGCQLQRWGGALLAALVVAGGVRVARAEEASGAGLTTPARAQGDWHGAWVGLELRGGLFVPGIDPSQGGRTHPIPRGLAGVSARVSTLMALLDVDLGVSVREAGRPDPRGTSAAGVSTTALLEVRGHPYFLRHLRGDWLLGGLYVSLGVGAELVSWRSEAGGLRHAGGFALAVGGGGDMPLGDPGEGGPSTWLGLGYRMRFAGVDGAPRRLGDRDGHEAWLAVSLRWHGVDFARVPRPGELDDRDP
jgi:hypothetical protein